jgi:hypothetical protein
MLAGVQILPHEARVKVGESVSLQVMVCERINEEDPDTHVVFVGLVEACKPSPLDALASGHWAVNGQEGGGPTSGTVVASTDHTSGIGTYTAPATKPAANSVSVSVQYEAPFDPTFQLLVATVTIEDQPGCEWLRSVDSLSADVSFDAFTFNSAGEFDSYTGNHAGRLIGTLTKVTGTGLPFDEWVTYFSPLTGKSVSINDTHNHFYPGEEYTETLLGNGSPHDGLDAPSLVSLKVNYDSCTYDLFASYTVDALATRDSSTSSKPIGIGGLYIYGQTFLPGQADAGSIQGEGAINAIFDTTRTGYVPLQLDTSWSLTGQTTAHWILSVSP